MNKYFDCLYIILFIFLLLTQTETITNIFGNWNKAEIK